MYRVAVRAGAGNVLLGFADVQPGRNGSGLRKIDLATMQQFEATVRGLHGNTLSAGVTWLTSDPTVAVIDAASFATGMAAARRL